MAIPVLPDKLDALEEREWYASAAVEYGCSRNVLMNMPDKRQEVVPGHSSCWNLRIRTCSAAVPCRAA
jgi:hypothetical protein